MPVSSYPILELRPESSERFEVLGSKPKFWFRMEEAGSSRERIQAKTAGLRSRKRTFGLKLARIRHERFDKYDNLSSDVEMSIKVIIQAPGLNLQAVVTDDALPELITITQKFRDQDVTSSVGVAPSSAGGKELPANTSGGPLSEEMLKTRLGSYGAAELLNQLQWDTYPEKILVLGAWHEARGGGTSWKSSDMDTVFKQAKESPPSNFPRDIKAAIKAGWIHTHTPRTYSVTRTGWNRVGEAVSKLNT